LPKQGKSVYTRRTFERDGRKFSPHKEPEERGNTEEGVLAYRRKRCTLKGFTQPGEVERKWLTITEKRGFRKAGGDSAKRALRTSQLDRGPKGAFCSACKLGRQREQERRERNRGRGIKRPIVMFWGGFWGFWGGGGGGGGGGVLGEEGRVQYGERYLDKSNAGRGDLRRGVWTRIARGGLYRRRNTEARH